MNFRIDRPFTFDRVLRLSFQIAFLAGVIWLLNKLSAVLIPFAVALLLAYLLNPLVNLFQNKLRIKNRVVSVILSLFLVTAIAAGAALLLVPMFYAELRDAGALIAQFVNDARLSHADVPVWIEEQLREFLSRNDVENLFDPDTLREGMSYVLQGSWFVVSGSLSFLVALLSLFGILAYLIFLLLDYENVAGNWKKWLPARYATLIEDVFSDLESSMRVYFRAQGLIALINGILFAIGFYIIGLPLGIFLGLLIGLFNMVPYLQWAGLPPALFFALIRALETGQSPWILMALVLLVFIIISVIEQLILTPRIMGDATGLNPAFMLLALSIWGSLLGILGMLIALPVSTLLISWYKRVLPALSAQSGEPETSQASKPPSADINIVIERDSPEEQHTEKNPVND